MYSFCGLYFKVFLSSSQGLFFSALIATFVSYWTLFQLFKKKKKRQHQTCSSQAEREKVWWEHSTIPAQGNTKSCI